MDITGLILAGGEGRRMNGLDKGLQQHAGRPLIEYAVERLRPQVDALLISANRNAEIYGRYAPVVADLSGGFLGPLAGIEAGLAACTTPWLAVVPCDSPAFPTDLVARLLAAAEGRGAAIVDRQPVFAVIRRDRQQLLTDYLAAGGRRLFEWYAGIGAVSVDAGPPDAFANFNTPADLLS
jgi:molybdopterin-guanine dinucleotide biosynthesis protein A